MVNGVSFGQRVGIYDRVNVDAPQAHQRPQFAPQAPEAPKKKGSFLKKAIGAVCVVAAAAAALAFGAKKGAFDPAKIAELTKGFKDASWISWAKKPAKAILGYAQKGGEYVNKGVEYVSQNAGKLFESVKGFFSKKTA